MAVYNLERVNLILVEDNRYVRHVLQDMLRQFRFGRITALNDGAEVIEYMKSVHAPTEVMGSVTVDMILSDLVMSPINGLLFLRWIRTAKESPNRFVPFVMLSGAADREYVTAARDLGVTEFIAKPFSATSVYKHILEVIDYPRQYVTTQTDFGPDRRRRRKPPPGGEEQRVNDDNSVAIVYSADKVVKPERATDVWYFRLANRLKEKAGSYGSTEPGELPVDLLKQAEENLERAALDFTEWAMSYIAKLSDLCTEALMKPGRRDTHFREINLIAHELRGQGGTFGYPLISIFGKMLYECTGEGCNEDDSAVEIAKAHVDAMRAVIREKVAGDGGQIGRDLLKALKIGIDKHSMVT